MKEITTLNPICQFFDDQKIALRAKLSRESTFLAFEQIPDKWITYLCTEKIDVSVSFLLKGYWIPENEGELFQADATSACPLVRIGLNGKEVLFLVHPKSEALFAPLMAKYRQDEMFVSAIPLSCPQTFFVAIPQSGAKQTYTYAVVKLSIDETLDGSIRLLPLKRCTSSVGTTVVFKHHHFPISFFNDDMAFVPDCRLVDPNHEQGFLKGAGMIHRTLPDRMFDAELSNLIPSGMIPFRALFENAGGFFDLLETSGQFIAPVVPLLLEKWAEIGVNLLFHKNLSMEVHADNLFLAIYIDDSERIHTNFVYKDMGGTNYLFSEKDRALLPSCLINPDYYYVNEHFQTAAHFFANFASRFLTRPLQKVFGEMVLKVLLENGIFRKFVQDREGEAFHFFENKLKNCSDSLEWFKELIFQIYPTYIRKGYHLPANEESVDGMDKSDKELLQRRIEKALSTCEHHPRPFYTSSSDIFEELVKDISLFLDSYIVLQAIRDSSFLYAMREQVKNHLKHLNLTFKKAHLDYCHAPVYSGPFPFKPSVNTLKSVSTFLSALSPVMGDTTSNQVQPKTLEEQIKRLKNENLAFVKELTRNPMQFYQELRQRVITQGVNASCHEFAGVIAFLELSLQRQQILDIATKNSTLEFLRQVALRELDQIKRAGFPYCDMLSAIEHCLGFFDIFERGKLDVLEQNPNIADLFEKGKRIFDFPKLFHSFNYQYYSAYLKNEIPNHFVIPTICALGAIDILKVRGVPIGFLGINTETIRVDGYLQTPLEFWFHDVNHTRRMWQFLQEKATSLGISTQEFTEISHNYVSETLIPLISIHPQDTDEVVNLKQVIKMILFEILHEDAFAAHPSVIQEALLAPPGTLIPIELISQNEVTYSMAKTAARLAYVHWKLVGSFYDTQESRKAFIVGERYRTKDWITKATLFLTDQLQLTGITESLVIDYLQYEQKYGLV